MIDINSGKPIIPEWLDSLEMVNTITENLEGFKPFVGELEDLFDVDFYNNKTWESANIATNLNLSDSEIYNAYLLTPKKIIKGLIIESIGKMVSNESASNYFAIFSNLYPQFSSTFYHKDKIIGIYNPNDVYHIECIKIRAITINNIIPYKIIGVKYE